MITVEALKVESLNLLTIACHSERSEESLISNGFASAISCRSEMFHFGNVTKRVLFNPRTYGPFNLPKRAFNLALRCAPS